MTTIDLTPLYRNSIGFDRLANMLDNAFQADVSSTSYPAYDIETMEDNRYAITVAVAGFELKDLDIEVEGNELTISGHKDKQENDSRQYLHRGIASRDFVRKFNLAEYVEVKNAKLEHGLLKIELKQELPESMKPRRINIETGNRALEHTTDAEVAA